MFRYNDSLIGLFLNAGFSPDLTHHAMHALGSRALGFTQELGDDSDVDLEQTKTFIRQMAGEYPNIAAMLEEVTHDADTTLGGAATSSSSSSLSTYCSTASRGFGTRPDGTNPRQLIAARPGRAGISNFIS